MLRLLIENTLDREGKIMAEWLRTSLMDIVELIGGGTPKTSKAEYWGGNINWLSVKDFNNENRYVYSTEKTITEEGLNNSSTKLLKKDDIIISARGTVGELAMIPFPMAFNQSCYGIRAKDGINSTFLYYLIKHSVRKLKAMTHGSVFDTITRDTFANIEVAIPDIETQQRVVKMLADIDDKVENNQRINNNLEQQAQAVYYKMFSEVNIVPVELSSIIDVRDGTHDSPKAQATGYYLITSKHLLPFGVDKASANHISKADFDKIKERSLVETQDILMSMIGTIGLISYIPYETVDFAIKNVALFKTSHTPELAYYFLCYLKSEKTLQHIGKCLAGSTQKYISLGELRKMPIYSPTTNEIREFNCLVKPMFEKIVSRTYENALLAEMRDSLLPKLMSGELDVSKIDI